MSMKSKGKDVEILSRYTRIIRAKKVYEHALECLEALGVIVSIDGVPYTVTKSLAVSYITKLGYPGEEDRKPDMTHPVCQPDWEATK